MKTEYFESAEVSDVGRKRKNNEDACLRIPERGIFCVADGMGGQAGGDLASEAITTNLEQVFTKAPPEADATFALRISLFRKAINQASKWIKNFADEKVIGQMGSTVVALVVDPRNPRRAVGLHAGDSRLYRYRKGEFEQITTDHSAVEALAAKLGLTPEQIPAKYQNELLRAVGLTEAVELEKTPVDVASGDIYLICSDGLTKMQTDAQIAKILKDGENNPLLTVAQALINAANEAGGRDNVTAVLVKAGDFTGAPNFIDPDEEEEDKTIAAPPTPTGEAQTPANTPSQVPAMPDTADVHGDTPHTPTPQTENDEPATVVKLATPVFAPAPAPKPTTAVTPTPTPVATPAPVPAASTATPAPVPLPTPASTPTIASTPISAPAPAPTPAPAQVQIPTPAPTPAPAATAPAATPVPTPTPAPKAAAEIPAAKKETKPESKSETKSETKPGTKPDIKISAAPKKKKDFPLIMVIVAAVILVLGTGIWLVVRAKSRPAPPTDEFPAKPANAKPVAPVAPAIPAKPADVKPAAPVVPAVPAKPAPPATVVNPGPDAAQVAAQEAGRAALKSAQAAFENRDYKNAAAFAAAALQKIPGDAAALKLQADAQAQLKILEDWRTALNNAQTAFNNRDYKNTVAWASAALAKIPNEAAATKLRDSAQQFLAETAELERKYQVALAAAQDALKQNNFALAETKAKEALTVRPGDPTATQIIKQLKVATDLEDARRFFAQGNYEAVAQIGQAYPGVDEFKQLAASGRTEQTALTEARNFFSAGDYSFIARLQNLACARKPPFAELLKQAAGEQSLLTGLESFQQSGDWKSARDNLASPALAAVANKAPFRAIGQWAQAQADQFEKQKAQQQLTITFEVLLVRFNIKKPTDPYITTTEAKKEVRLDGILSEQDRQRYQDIIASLETGFGKPSTPIQNDRAKLLKELKDTVIHHE